MAVGLEQILAEGLTQMRDEIIRASQDAGQEASGRTYAQITVQTGREGETVWGSIEAPNYFYTLIRGRGPGKIPANLGQIIMEWAKLKGITSRTQRIWSDSEMLLHGRSSEKAQSFTVITFTLTWSTLPLITSRSTWLSIWTRQWRSSLKRHSFPTTIWTTDI